MHKLAKELLAVGVIVLLTLALVLVFTGVANGQGAAATFGGSVHQVPISVSSPVYGQIVALPVTEGTLVTHGQVVAVIQSLDPHVRPFSVDGMYRATGSTVEVLAPTDGIVGNLFYGEKSTIAATGAIMDLFASDSAQIWVLIPKTTDLAQYHGFSVAVTPDGQKYPIQLLRQVPITSPDPALRDMYIYAASFVHTADAQSFLTVQQVSVFGQKKDSSPLQQLFHR